MSDAILWALVLCATGTIVVRRRSVAIGLVALESLLLGAQAIGEASDSGGLIVGVIVLVAKGLVLPALLLAVARRTREPGPILSERHPLARLPLAATAALLVVALMPRLGLRTVAVEHAAVGLIALGLMTAVTRRAAIFQAIGFLTAENGLYLAALGVRGGVPAFIELGLVFDLVVIVTVAGVFSAKIHEELGTTDTSLLRGLRD